MAEVYDGFTSYSHAADGPLAPRLLRCPKTVLPGMVERPPNFLAVQQYGNIERRFWRMSVGLKDRRSRQTPFPTTNLF